MTYLQMRVNFVLVHLCVHDIQHLMHTVALSGDLALDMALEPNLNSSFLSSVEPHVTLKTNIKDILLNGIQPYLT